MSSNITASPSFIPLRLSAIKLKSVAFINPNEKIFYTVQVFRHRSQRAFTKAQVADYYHFYSFRLRYSIVGMVLVILYKSSIFPVAE